jgi:Retrotransposon gag protein
VLQKKREETQLIILFKTDIKIQITSSVNSTYRFNTSKMADQILLPKARKVRFNDLPNFSGHSSEDVERFLKSIKNITKASDKFENHEILEIVRGKLTKSAGLWFDNNEHNFKSWSDFEIQFRNRYSSTITYKKFDKLKQRTQLPDEPITSYIDDVINLCQELDPNMSELLIIQHLMSGLIPDLRKELARRASSLITLNEFIKYAKIEYDLYGTFEKIS